MSKGRVYTIMSLPYDIFSGYDLEEQSQIKKRLNKWVNWRILSKNVFYSVVQKNSKDMNLNEIIK